MQEYVLGFAFTPKDLKGNQKVALIEKLKPEWQRGKFNGIGGKLEKDDISKHCAMSREFEEETGVSIHPECWDYIGKMSGDGSWCVHVFTTVSKTVENVKTVEQERILLVDPVKELDYILEKGITNVPWLIFSCLDVDYHIGRCKLDTKYGGSLND